MSMSTYTWSAWTTDSGPFDLQSTAAFESWADKKLLDFEAFKADPVVEIANHEAISESEFSELQTRIRQSNMALYAWQTPCPDESLSKQGVVGLGARFGLQRLDSNLHADADSLTSLKVCPDGDKARYIPYTSRPISWHCDGYYNAYEKRIRAMVLHCVRPSFSGGENTLYDPEILYLLLRRENPDHIRALMAPEAMAIPANDGPEGEIRPTTTGPVFTVDEDDGALHMRYSARKRNIIWAEDASTQAAVAATDALLKPGSPYILRHRMEAGQGLICNNVLHTRTGFEDSTEGATSEDQGRLMLRGRYFDRIRDTGERS